MSSRARRLVLAADGDRRRIERELHDGLQQDLVALVVNLQLARRLLETDAASGAALLDEIRRDAQAALDATRALALRIYPPLLDAAGLRAALRAAAPGTTVDVAVGAECPKELVSCVYFCCLELLPGASRITIRQDREGIALEVATSTSTDLTRVEDRVEAFGGRLIEEQDRITAVLPVPQ